MSSSSTFCYFWKILTELSVPVQGLFIDVFVLLLKEFMKFCVILLLVFAFGYLIFYLWDTARNEGQQALGSDFERLSAGLMENGSFSKYPYVVELSTKASAESLKAKKKL